MQALRAITPLARPIPRAVYGLLAAVLAAGAIALVLTRDVSGWAVLAFALAPDIALVAGFAPGLARGQPHTRAVPLYNALHAFPGPILLGAAALLWLGPLWQAGALAWGAHIALDRALGYGFRAGDGFIRG